MPRSVSWPVSRTGTPSASSDANASASACAQSIPAPSSIALRRRSRNGCSLRCTSKSSGVASSCSLSFRSVSAGTVVRGSRLIVRSSSTWCSPVSGGPAIDSFSFVCASWTRA